MTGRRGGSRKRPDGEPSLRRRLTEAEGIIQALLAGKIDAAIDPTTASAVMLREAQAELQRLHGELAQSEAHFRSLIENVSDLLTVTGADGTIRYQSPSIRGILGHEPHDLIGQSLLDLVHPDDRQNVERTEQRAIAMGRAADEYVSRYRHQDGSWRHLESVVVNLLDNPAVSGLVVTSRDITERLEMEGRHRGLIENMSEGFTRCRLLFADGQPTDFVFLETNHAFETLTGFADLVGKKASEVVPGVHELHPELLERFDRVVRTGSGEKFEIHVPAIAKWLYVSSYEAGPECFVAVFDDITTRKETEARLRRAEAEYRGLVEQAPLGVLRSTADGRILAANPALVSLLGYASSEDVLRLVLQRDVYVRGSDREALVSRALEASIAVAETTWKRQDGSHIDVRIHARRSRVADEGADTLDTIVEDITGWRSLQQQVEQSQKMEAVGRLAGGVAHDFNNLLTAVLGYADLLYEDMGSGDPRREDIDEVRRAAQRGVTLTRQLLAFSRKQVLQPRVLDVNDVVRGVEKMLRRLISEDIELVTALSESPVTVRADAGQLEQILVNLAVNARDAMIDGGRLSVETNTVELDDEYASQHEGITPGRFAMISVSDTGVGMNADVRQHLFEPFYTTKKPGKGTGLGLSTVYGIVRQSGGSIWVYSEPGLGAVFKIYLPLESDVTRPVETASAPEPVSAGGNETILVVDDNRGIGNIATRILSKLGYSILRADSGEAALEVSRSHPAVIDLLLTDVVMPGMGGSELARRLAAERPGTPVILMSGYADDDMLASGKLAPGTRHLAKPFTADTLAHIVRQALDAPG